MHYRVSQALFQFFAIGFVVLTTASADIDKGRNSSGELSLEWSNGTQSTLENWTMSLDIYEGDDRKDDAELSMLVTSTDLSERVAITIPLKDVTPNTLELTSDYKLGEGDSASDVILELWRDGEHFTSTSGKFVISKHLGGHVIGSFQSKLNDQSGENRLSVSGVFNGKVKISCNAFGAESGPQQEQSHTNSQSDSEARSWKLVSIEHPFCTQYL